MVVTTKSSSTKPAPAKHVLNREHFDQLLEVLKNRGYQLLGPTVHGASVTLEEIQSSADLPRGWTDEQDGGTYRLKRQSDETFFGYAASPQSWKKFLFPSVRRLWEAQRKGHKFTVTKDRETDPPSFAFIGVRSCDLSAIAIQDKVFLHSPYVDPLYQGRRERAFIVAMNCTNPGGTCFCASRGTGPAAKGAYDLVFTEVLQDGDHFFVVEVGSQRGAAVLGELPQNPAREEQVKAAEALVSQAAGRMGRSMDTSGIKELLYSNSESSRWETVATRCLSCTNCTLVCPTCFCHAVEDSTDLGGDVAERTRNWDSCFNLSFSYIHGGSVRYSVAARYRQWMTHKLASWYDQFGTSGCVGCGRCITWCPVGIDITEEVRAIREGDRTTKGVSQ
jgi:sulfhydrogenase subunit beta (sulfur reductase)